MKRSALYASAAALLAAAVTVQAAPYTYDWHNADATDAKWSTAMNWFGNLRPGGATNTDELVFNLRKSILPAGSPIWLGANTLQNQANPFKLLSLTYAATNEPGIKIGGSPLLFDNDIKMLTNNTNRLHHINVGVTLAGIYPLHFGGVGAASAEGQVKITGVIGGTAGIKVNHAPGGTLQLTGANTFGGGVEVAAGELLVGHDSALGSGQLTISGGIICAADVAVAPTNIYEIKGSFAIPRNTGSFTTVPIVKKLELRGDGKITGSRTVNVNGVGVIVGGQRQEVLALTGALTATSATDGLKFVNTNPQIAPTIRRADPNDPDPLKRGKMIVAQPNAMVTIGREGGWPSPDFQGTIEVVGLTFKLVQALGSNGKEMAGATIGDPAGPKTAFIGREASFFCKNNRQVRFLNPPNSTNTVHQLGLSPGTTTVSGGGGYYMDAMAGFNVFIEGLTPGDDPGQHSQLVMNDNGPITLVHDPAYQTRPILFTTLSEVYTPEVGDRYKIIDQTSSLAPRLDADDNLFQIGTNGAWIVSGGGSADDLSLYDGTVFENGDGVMWMMRYGLVPGIDPGAGSQDENDVFLTVAGLDCNTNSVPDDQDIASGASQDCDFNGVPDECEPDCNGNLVPDACDIAAGTSQDCNADGVPNECEPDCNGNSLPDPCDIAFGASPDCDLNGVPDECDPDCNGNFVADGCDIVSGTSLDCDLNGVPDECQPDCNGNFVADACDIDSGVSTDCNLNSVPDECDMGAGTSSDCNFNSIPDECETDCNGNSLPDECEQPGPLSGSAVAFDGMDDFVGVPGFGAIVPSTEITVEFWQKADAVRPQFTLALGPDMAANRLAASAPWSDGKVYWDFGDISGAGRLSYTPAEPIIGSWQHFALVASQSGNTMRIYRNGVLEATKSGMDPLAPAGRSLRIGGLPGSFFGGLIDEVRIWNVARTQGQIQSTMNSTLSGEEPGLLAYWRLDEGTGMMAADSAGNSDGSLVNGPAWTALYSDYNANGVPDECESCGGDADGDGDVDLSDYVGFTGCMSGPVGGLGAGCDCFDLDVSGDVDLIDFAEFQALFTGEP